MENSITRQSSDSPRPFLGQRWGRVWILGNSLVWGLTLGMPFVLADLIAEGTPSIQRYNGYVIPALLIWMMSLGLTQWTMLRKPLGISASWISSFIFPRFVLPAALLLIPAAAAVFPILGQTTFLLLLGTSPLLPSLDQWFLLRQRIKPAWTWIWVSWLAIATAVLVGFILAAILTTTSNGQTDLGIWVCVGGGISGLIYGLITALGLKQLIREHHIPATLITQKSGLDVPPGDKPWQRLIIPNLLFLVILFGWGAILPRPNFSSGGASALETLFIIVISGLFLTLYSYFSILVHELGHLIFALCNGFEMQAIAVDRFVFSRSGKGFKSSRIKHRFAGGFVLPVLKNSRNSRQKLIWMFFGGPAASFSLFAVGAVPVLFPNWLSRSYGVWLITLFASYNLFICIYNLLPFQIGFLKTDGRRMLDLQQGNRHGKRVEYFYHFNAALRQGIRPKDIEPEVIEGSLAIPEQSSEHVSSLMMAYLAALDQAEFDRAGDYLDQALQMNAYCPQLFRASLFLEGTYFEAQIRQQPNQAQQWFEQIQDTALIEPYSLLRAEAALLLAQGEPNAALVKAEQGLASAQQEAFKRGLAAAECEWLQTLLQSASDAAREMSD